MADRAILTITGPGGKTLDLVFDDLAGRARAVITYLGQDLWDDAADSIFSLLEEIMGERFATEGAYGGDQWQGNSPPYRWMKQALRGHQRVGEDTGELKRSLTERTASGAVRQVIQGGIRFGTNVPHARDFNDGTAQTRGFNYGGWNFVMDGTPPHPIFEFQGIRIDDEVARRLQRVVVDNINEFFGGRRTGLA